MRRSANRIVVVGAGGHAKVVIATARAAGLEVVSVHDDEPTRWGHQILGVPIKGPVSSEEIKNMPAIIAIGNNRVRQAIEERVETEWVSVCHPDATVHSSVSLGPGTVIFAGAVIQPAVILGNHSIVNTAASIDHDCLIESFVHVGPGVRICGGVTVEEGGMLGAGATVTPNIRLGPWATAGAGAVCLADVEGGATVVGIPASPV